MKKDLDKNFSIFKSIGIKTVLGLEQALKNKSEMAEFIERTGISEEYLQVLSRELKSIQPAPVKLAEFRWISHDTISKLEKNDIKNTAHLYDKVLTKKNRKELSARTGVGEKSVLELAKLTDLTRIQWVNSTFARLLFMAGYDTVQKVSKADYAKLHAQIVKMNKEQEMYRGNIGLNDMKICIEAAKEVPSEIRY